MTFCQRKQDVDEIGMEFGNGLFGFKTDNFEYLLEMSYFYLLKAMIMSWVEDNLIKPKFMWWLVK